MMLKMLAMKLVSYCFPKMFKTAFPPHNAIKHNTLFVTWRKCSLFIFHLYKPNIQSTKISLFYSTDLVRGTSGQNLLC